MRSFPSRAELSEQQPLKAYLYHLIATKKTNLCVSADVNTTTALLKLAEEVGDYICVLKTHADIVDDFSDRTIRGLVDVSTRKRFLIFEDRKFGDIGNTVKLQYTRGPFRIASWAHLVNAHIFPGSAIIDALKASATEAVSSLQTSVSTEISTGTPHDSEAETEDEPVPRDEDAQKRGAAALSGRKGSVVATTTIHQTVHVSRHTSGTDLASSGDGSGSSSSGAAALEEGGAAALGEPPPARGLLLLAQMSSAGNRMDAAYTRACVEAAREHPDFVVGFVAQQDLNATEADNFVSMTPGVSLPRQGEDVKGDSLGQQYRTPEAVIRRSGCDIVIVGRGIVGAEDRAKEAARYRAEAWKAYERKLGASA